MLRIGVPVLPLGGEGVFRTETTRETSVRSLSSLFWRDSSMALPCFIAWLSGHPGIGICSEKRGQEESGGLPMDWAGLT